MEGADLLPVDTTHQSGVRRWPLRFVAGIAILLLGIVAVERTVSGTSDLRGFHRIWQANLLAPTQPTRQHGTIEQDPDPYPPTSYVIFAPLGYLPLPVAGVVWFLLNLGCSYGIWRTTAAWLGPDPATRRALIWGAIGVFPFWLGNLLAGQNGPLLMWLALTAFTCAHRGKSAVGGVILAVATCIKVIPAALLFPFLMRRDWRMLGGFATGMFGLVVVLSSLFFGPKVNRDFQIRWLNYAVSGTEGAPDPTRPDSMRGSTRYNNQSVEAVLARLLMPIPTKSDSLYVNVMNVDAATWRQVRTTANVLLGCGVLVWFWQRRKPASFSVSSYSNGNYQTGEEFAAASLLMLWLSPIVWSHYYVWMFVPLTLLALRMEQGDRLARIGLVVWLVAVPLIGIREARAVGVHLWSTLIVGMAIAAPDFLVALRSPFSKIPRTPGTLDLSEDIATQTVKNPGAMEPEEDIIAGSKTIYHRRAG